MSTTDKYWQKVQQNKPEQQRLKIESFRKGHHGHIKEVYKLFPRDRAVTLVLYGAALVGLVSYVGGLASFISGKGRKPIPDIE